MEKSKKIKEYEVKCCECGAIYTTDREPTENKKCECGDGCFCIIKIIRN